MWRKGEEKTPPIYQDFLLAGIASLADRGRLLGASIRAVPLSQPFPIKNYFRTGFPAKLILIDCFRGRPHISVYNYSERVDSKGLYGRWRLQVIGSCRWLFFLLFSPHWEAESQGKVNNNYSGNLKTHATASGKVTGSSSAPSHRWFWLILHLISYHTQKCSFLSTDLLHPNRSFHFVLNILSARQCLCIKIPYTFVIL